MPLTYSGEEAANPNRLAFFEKDPIEWKDHYIGDLYKELFALMKSNTALWHAEWGARMIKVPNSAETEVLSFVRRNDKDKVFAVFNFSATEKDVQFKDALYHGEYVDYFSKDSVSFGEASTLKLKAWDYKVFVKQ